MNILLLGLSVLKEGFQACGHDVLTCTSDNTGDVRLPEFPIEIDRVLQDLPHGWDPDFVLLTDESTHPLFLGLEHLNVPVGWYAIDSHLHHRWHKAYAAVFDLIFVAQRDFESLYVRDESRQCVRWLPLFSLSDPTQSVQPLRRHNLSFVGTNNYALNPLRHRLLEELQQVYPLNVETGDYISVFLQSKMVLNQCIDNDVNFRTFEAMACGALLLMERVGNGLKDLFQDRVHCVLYEKGNIEQIIEIAEYYMLHEDERIKIAALGRSEVLSKHTGVHRAQTILDMLAAIDRQAVLQQRRARQGEILFLLAPVYEYAASRYVESATSRFLNNQSMASQATAVAEKFRHAGLQIHHRLGM
ncbi:glycosyltransferase family protein [Nitrospira sp. M1]